MPPALRARAAAVAVRHSCLPRLSHASAVRRLCSLPPLDTAPSPEVAAKEARRRAMVDEVARVQKQLEAQTVAEVEAALRFRQTQPDQSQPAVTDEIGGPTGSGARAQIRPPRPATPAPLGAPAAASLTVRRHRSSPAQSRPGSATGSARGAPLTFEPRMSDS